MFINRLRERIHSMAIELLYYMPFSKAEKLASFIEKKLDEIIIPVLEASPTELQNTFFKSFQKFIIIPLQLITLPELMREFDSFVKSKEPLITDESINKLDNLLANYLGKEYSDKITKTLKRIEIYPEISRNLTLKEPMKLVEPEIADNFNNAGLNSLLALFSALCSICAAKKKKIAYKRNAIILSIWAEEYANEVDKYVETIEILIDEELRERLKDYRERKTEYVSLEDVLGKPNV